MGRAQLTYSSKDYASIRQELLDRVPQLTDRWTDFNASDLGVVLLELFCGIGDMLAYYLDAQAVEAFLPTARQRQSILNLCKLIDYRLGLPVAASTTLRFTLSTALSQDLLIPAGTACRALLDEGQVDFETIEDALIPRGSVQIETGARQGIRKSETFTGSGAPWQRLVLPGKAIAQGTLSVRVDGSTWQEVLHFQESDPDSPHFLAETDHLDATTLSFGDGRRGRVPPSGATLEGSWLETQGEAGNLGPNRITQVLTPIYLGESRIRLSVTNPIAASGGSDRETHDHARAQAPAELRTLWKAVTQEDYRTLAEGFPGVAKARVLDTNDCTNIRYYNVHLAIAPCGGGIASPVLKHDLAEFLEARKVVTVEIRLFDPIYRAVPVGAEVYVWPGEQVDQVRSRLEQALREFFDFKRVSFGQTIHFSDLVALLDGTRGVSHVRMTAPGGDIAVGRGEIPVLGEVHLEMKRAEYAPLLRHTALRPPPAALPDRRRIGRSGGVPSGHGTHARRPQGEDRPFSRDFRCGPMRGPLPHVPSRAGRPALRRNRGPASPAAADQGGRADLPAQGDDSGHPALAGRNRLGGDTRGDLPAGVAAEQPSGAQHLETAGTDLQPRGVPGRLREPERGSARGAQVPPPGGDAESNKTNTLILCAVSLN